MVGDGSKSIAKTKSRHRIGVHLDPRIALEAIILNRLECIPNSRRQEWLRGFVVEGFRAECLTLRSVLEPTESGAARAFRQWLAGAAKDSNISKAARPSQQVSLPQVKADGKPFAALGKVMG